MSSLQSKPKWNGQFKKTALLKLVPEKLQYTQGTLPVISIFGRHGQTDSNARIDVPNILPNSQVPLTKKGVVQSKSLGTWLQYAFPEGFDGVFVSPFPRALETAYYSGIVDMCEQGIKEDFRIIEVSRGKYNQDNKADYKQDFEWQAVDKVSSPNANGEMQYQAMSRVSAHLDMLARSYSSGITISICHGELMGGILSIILRMNTLEYTNWYKDYYIRNTELMIFSRIDNLTGIEHPHYVCYGLYCPYQDLAYNWIPIVRQSYNKEGLLALIEAKQLHAQAYLTANGITDYQIAEKK